MVIDCLKTAVGETIIAIKHPQTYNSSQYIYPICQYLSEYNKAHPQSYKTISRKRCACDFCVLDRQCLSNIYSNKSATVLMFALRQENIEQWDAIIISGQVTGEPLDVFIEDIEVKSENYQPLENGAYHRVCHFNEKE